MTDPAPMYMHKLDQLTVELRDAADSMEAMLEEMRDQRDNEHLELPELNSIFMKFIEYHGTKEVVDRLVELVEQMKNDDALKPEPELQQDLVNCNKHAVRLCQAQYEIAKIITGA